MLSGPFFFKKGLDPIEKEMIKMEMIFNPILLFPSYSKILYFISFLNEVARHSSFLITMYFTHELLTESIDPKSWISRCHRWWILFLYPFRFLLVRFLLVSAVYNDWWIKNFRLDLILSIGISSYPDYFVKVETWVSALETYVEKRTYFI